MAINRCVSLAGVLLVGVLLFPPTDARAEATPADVLVSVQKLESEVELVRSYLGKTKSDEREFFVTSATPRHSFFLAQAIVRKLNILIQENAGGSTQTAPAAPNRAVTPEDVLGVLNRAHDQLSYLKEDLGLTDTMPARSVSSRADETDNVQAMVRVLRQINLMLLRRYLPKDVFERIDLATVYVAGVLKNQGLEMFPEAEFVMYKQPAEVFSKLIDCAVLSAQIAELTGVDALKLDARRMRTSKSRLSNNYDLATILLSDIAEWTEALEGADDVFPETPMRRHTVPSHVYQKTLQLEAQLKAVLGHLRN